MSRPEQSFDPPFALDQILRGMDPTANVVTGPGGLTMTGAALRRHIEILTTTLAQFPTGTRVATLLPDAPQTALALLALCHHVQVMPLNPALTDRELNDILASSGAKLLLSGTQTPASTRAATLASDLSIPHATLDGSTLTLPQHRLPEPARSTAPSPTANPGLILLTSGSTGAPKRVPLTTQQLHLSAARIAKALELTPADRAVHALPMFHIGAIVDLLLAPLLARSTVHFSAGMGARDLHDAVTSGRATWLQVVPTMLARLRAELSPEQAQTLGAHLRFIRSVSADLAPEMQRAAETFFADTPILQMYGMTETAGQITTNPLPPAQRKSGSVGKASGVEIRIQDGEIQVRGDSVTTGYEGIDPSAHITADGYLRTGDLGRIDTDGYLFLTGRIKDMINRGGEKISPFEIEHAALNAPGVIEAAAFPRTHPTLGQEVGLAVSLTPPATADTVKHHLSNVLAEFKIPRKITVLDPLPRLGSGKIDKQSLITQAQDDGQAPSHNTKPQAEQTSDALSDQIAAVWNTVLANPNNAAPTPETDFFDAGGDSLAGAQFLFEVERLSGRALPTNLLYEAPRFAEFCAAAAAAPLRDEIASDDPKHQFLQNRLADWDAAPVSGAPLLRVIGQDAPETPLFWCAQEEGEHTQLAAALGATRPLYLMRSLFLMVGKNDAMSRDLAADYARDIMRLQPGGDLCLGGFCEGAKIMNFAADYLRAAGRTVRVLICWDQWLDEPAPVPILHLWTDDRLKRFQTEFGLPERAAQTRHDAALNIHKIGGGHTEILTRGPLTPILPILSDALNNGLSAKNPAPKPLFTKQTSGTVRARSGPFLPKSRQVPIDLDIRNTGTVAWPASPDAPLTLIAKLVNLDGYTRAPQAGLVQITQPIAAGETRRCTLPLDMPNRSIPMWLHFELYDDAANPATQGGGVAARKLVIPRPF
jgi:acyl-CoA synthetase (AMP-forming)/AMP-acid ligase II